MGRVSIGTAVTVGRAAGGMTGGIAAVAIGAAGPARAAAMTGLIGAGAAVAVRQRTPAMAGAIGRILIGNLGFGRAGAKHGQRSTPNDGPTGNPAKK
jgi:hypothetical protein